MLPNFRLPVVLNGAPRYVIAADVPTGVFFAGFPNTVPLTECFDRETAAGKRGLQAGLEAWLDALLTRVVIAPRLTPELVHRLGDGRDELATAYLRAVGWAETEDGSAPELAGALLEPVRVEAEPFASRAVLGALPESNIRRALRLLAKRAHTPPHVVWQQWFISEFIWSWRVLLTDVLLDRDGFQPELN